MNKRLLTEVAIFAERCDIHEELVRLQSHLEQFRETLQIEEPVEGKWISSCKRCIEKLIRLVLRQMT